MDGSDRSASMNSGRLLPAICVLVSSLSRCSSCFEWRPMFQGMCPHTSVRVISTAVLLGFVMLSFSMPAVCSAGERDITVKRRNTYDAHVREREARESKERFQKEEKARTQKHDERVEERAQRRRNGGKTDDELDDENFGARTLGGVCMYGAKGDVIYRPPGAHCKGDSVLPRFEEDWSSPVAAPANVGPATAPVIKLRGKSTMLQKIRHKTPKKERCLWINGRVAFKPEGVDCYAR
jgi:hypothetical protein